MIGVLKECLEGAQGSLLLCELFQPTVEPSILVAEASSECIVGSARGPAVHSQVLSGILGPLE